MLNRSTDYASPARSPERYATVQKQESANAYALDFDIRGS